jgi:hypothetical protein
MSQPPPFPAPQPGFENQLPPGAIDPHVVAPYVIKQETTWTYPLQVATCAFFVISAAATVLVLFATADLHDQFNTAMSQALNNSGDTGRYTPAQVKGITDATLGIVIGVVVIWAVLKGLLGALGLQRWSWVWVMELIVLCFFVFFGLFSELALLVEALGGRVTQSTAIQGVLSLAADGLLIWMLIANFRYGAWAVQKVPWVPPPEQAY